MFLPPVRGVAPDSVGPFIRGSRRVRSRRGRAVAGLELLESRQLLAMFAVTTTADNGDNSSPTPGSLRAAIIAANAATPGPNNIQFDIPASTAPGLDVPVPGFDPATQDWTITLASALPTITTTVDIDGYSQAHVGVPYFYPQQTSHTPTIIRSASNSTAAIDGNNAHVRVIIDGSQTNGATGFVLDTSSAILRGLAIDGFGTAVSVPQAADAGNLIQGNYLGRYLVYPVDPLSGTPLPAPYAEDVAGSGNSPSGNAQPVVDIYGTNTTLGGASPQDDNVVAGNAGTGVVLEPGAEGGQVLGNQIGIIGPSTQGVYYQVPNDGPGVLVESSSNRIGAAGAGNLISANLGDGVDIFGIPATQNAVAGNYIGIPPGGGYPFGNGNPGNVGDGVNIQNAANNTIGGPSAGTGNVISANSLAGVSITGPSAIGTVVSNNIIGLTSDAGSELGNGLQGVAVYTSYTQVGPRNVISANMVGVLISGATVTNVTVNDNLIGTDGTGENDLGNEFQGVLVDGASGITIQGDGAGSQVISGNNVGIEIRGATATGNLIEGSLIGTDKAGMLPLPNAQQGILIDQDSAADTIGGATATARNLISANHWGIVIDGPAIGADWVLGNRIGTDITGLLPLGNEIDGVDISGSSNNTIGGPVAADGNTIGFNTFDGVNVLSGTGDEILSNDIFSDGKIGINLNGTANDNIAAPVLIVALSDSVINNTEIDGTYSATGAGIFLIQFFSNTAADPAGNYEGQTFLGSTTVKTSASGNSTASFAVNVPLVAPGSWVTATATYLSPTPSTIGLNAGDTSQFSGAVQAINPFLVTSTGDTATLGTLRYAITYSNAHPGPSALAPNPITFQIPGTGLQTIELQSALPAITEPVAIDGYSQPGAYDNDTNKVVGIFVFPNDNQETDVANILVQIDGSQLGGSDVYGLDITVPASTVDGLILTGFSGAAIALEPQAGNSTIGGSLGDTVWGNFIGVSKFNPKTFNPVNPARNNNANGVGILVDSGNNVIGGTTPESRNVIQGNSGDGVILFGTQGTRNTLASNFILDNGGDGVLALSASNQIGQATAQGPAGAGNVISGNGGDGVHILGPSARGNVVAGNEIGTQVGLVALIDPIRGTLPRPNAGDGVLIENAPANVIGGQIPFAGNVIAANGLDGVVIENYVSGTVPVAVPASAGVVVNSLLTAATGNQVQGNSIGFNNRNFQIESLPNRDGVFVSSAGNLIGGDAVAARNVIIDNNRNGVTISPDQLDGQNNLLSAIPNAHPTANVVAGNYIGTQAGNNVDGNALDGVLVYAAASNSIGGTANGAGNVISGNTSGVVLQAANTTGNLVAGNIIGLTADGSAPLGNATDGIAVLNASGNLIGGTATSAANVVAGNLANGVHLSGSGTTGNTLWGNDIGTNALGADLLGNAGDGLAIDGAASNNSIGGTIAGAANTIAFNGGAGIGMSSGTGNTALSNAISGNAMLGIVLSGVANNAQAAPTLLAAIPSTPALIEGSLASSPATSFLVQFFSNTTADPSGFGQGQALVGSTMVTTDSGGNAPFTASLPAALATGVAVSATATNLSTGDTSAFSNDVLAQPVQVQFAAAVYTVSEAGGSATITVKRTGNLGAAFSVAYATSGGTAAAGVNYTATQGTLNFSPNQTAETFTVPIDATTSPSGDLTVGLSLSNPSGGAILGTPSTSVLTIVDNRPLVVQFGASAYTVDESAGTATITVVRNSSLGSTSVAYATGGGTAVPGADYTATSGTLTFSPGQTSATFTVPLAGATSQGGQWTVGLTLSKPQGASLGSPAAATLTLTASAGTLEFGASSVVVPSSAGGTVITVNRVGGASGTVSVPYTTTALTAIPGVDFTPVSGTLTFAPGVTQETFTLPVLGNGGNPNDGAVAISLSAPTGGAVLGGPSTETVTIAKPLIITSEQVVTNGASITAITFAFNKALDSTRAQNLANYGVFVITASAGGVFGPAAKGSTRIIAARYDPTSRTVTLVPGAPLALNHVYRIAINGQASDLLNNGLSDANGIGLAGSNGVVGSPFVATFGVGTRLSYSDASGNVVSLRLRRGGLMELIQAPDGNVQRLNLIGTVPNKSILTGSVHRGRRRARTVLPPITGSAGVRIRLSARSFARPTAAIADVAEAVPRIVVLAPGAPRPFARHHGRR